MTEEADPPTQAALDDPQIEKLIARYKREMARYEKAAAAVADRLRRELRGAAIKHMVAHRAKHPSDLLEKLRRKSVEKPDVYSWEKLDLDIGAVATDLAGCRVVVYWPEDEAAVAEIVKKTFVQPDRPDAQLDRRRKVGEVYWATHALVHPYGTNDAEPDEAIEGALCEVQIVTVASHLYNEIEHDIVYKEKTRGGPADDSERQLLDELRGVARVADRLVAELREYRQTRISESRSIEDPEELRFAFWKLAGRRVEGEFARLKTLLDILLVPVTAAAIRGLGEFDALIECGQSALGDDAADFDELSLYAVGLRADFSGEIDAVAEGFTGPDTPMRRALDLARRREHTEEVS
ncbi:MAG: RelA/SpoT domain-containing protein [Sandaracinus sp.]|nr:RelA/SpoT domain-containing protein [Sandaracinus sp.]